MEPASAKDVAMKWGVILGVISIVLFLIGAISGTQTESWFSWLGVIPTVAIIVLAHKQFKEDGDGYMSYGEGLKVGMLVVLISSILSVIFTYIYIKFVDSNYVEAIREQSIADMQEQGLSDAQIEQGMSWTETFTSPEMIAVFGILGALFFGFIISLIISAFTKNNNPELEV